MTEPKKRPFRGPVQLMKYRGVEINRATILTALSLMRDEADEYLSAIERGDPSAPEGAKLPGAVVLYKTARRLLNYYVFTDREKEIVALAFHAGTAYGQMNSSEALDRGLVAKDAKDRERRTKAKRDEATKRRFATAVDMHLRQHPKMPPITAAKQVEQIYTEGGEKEEHGWRTLHRAWKRFGVERKSDRPSP
jgi:hypothetical protein